MRLESPFLFLESFTGHSPAHFVLLWAQPSRGACSLLRNGSWRTVLEPGHGEHLALAVQEGQSGTGYLGGSFLVVQ